MLAELDIHRAALTVFTFCGEWGWLELLDYGFSRDLGQDVFECIKDLIEIDPEICLRICLLLQEFLELALLFV